MQQARDSMATMRGAMQGTTQGTTQGLSDKALAVFAFAAYHQLDSGQTVASVLRRDGAGHSADAAAVAELEARGLVAADAFAIAFTPAGERLLQQAVQALRQSLGGP